MSEIENLRQRLKIIEEEIKEAERRLPAHSTKPPTMMMLLQLEDERDEILARMKRLQE